jgi:hypothetical protein
VAYEIADVTAAATYYIAETYSDFSRSLVESERPADLPAAQLSEYEAALDEEAFPFEEKSIAFHEKNLEMMRTGKVNAWTEKSLGRLAEMVPGRSAKQEVSSGLLRTLDGYVYRTPLSQMPPPPASPQAEPDQMPAPGPTGQKPPAAEPSQPPHAAEPSKQPAEPPAKGGR